MQSESHVLLKWIQTDGQNRLRMLFVGCFLGAYVSWFSEYWQDQTVILVLGTLLITFMVELFHKLRRWMRKSIQLMLILAVLAFYLEFQLMIRPLHSWQDVLILIHHNWVQLVPLLWFSLSAWLIYLWTHWWMQNKARILVLVIGSVLLMCGFDSFSPLQLWTNVAAVIFSGMCLLVIQHFGHLKRKSPATWSHLTDYPHVILVPVIALITVTMTAGLAAPDVGSLVTDPYTAWKNWQGEEVSTIGDGSGGRERSGTASSGYSRNDQELGGHFDFDHSEVMTVDASQRGYWRGETRSMYTGSGWEQSESEQERSLIPVTGGEALEQDSIVDTSQLLTEEVEQTVTILTDDSFPVLFGTYSIEQVHVHEADHYDIDDEDQADQGTDQGNGADNESELETLNEIEIEPGIMEWAGYPAELRWDEERGGEYPQTYTVISQMPVIDEDGLRSVAANYTDSEWDEYLQLPETLPDRVVELTEEITADAPTAYDAVIEIEEYLSFEFPYTNEPDVSQASSEDFVDQFLFEVQEGYCDYYSTAMVVMARSQGIPARWVKGYSPGQLYEDQYEMMMYEQMDRDPDGPGEYTVRNSNAHSWVEVYFEGFGWIPFEPTPGFTLPVAQVEDDSISVAEMEPITDTTGQGDESGWSVGQRIRLVLFIVVILVLIVWFILNKYDLWGRIQHRLSARNVVCSNQKIVMEYERLLHYFKRKGCIRYNYETAREAMKRWMQEHQWIKENQWMRRDMEVLLAIFERAKYSHADLKDEDMHTATKMIAKLREEL